MNARVALSEKVLAAKIQRTVLSALQFYMFWISKDIPPDGPSTHSPLCFAWEKGGKAHPPQLALVNTKRGQMFDVFTDFQLYRTVSKPIFVAPEQRVYSTIFSLYLEFGWNILLSSGRINPGFVTLIDPTWQDSPPRMGHLAHILCLLRRGYTSHHTYTSLSAWPLDAFLRFPWWANLITHR